MPTSFLGPENGSRHRFAARTLMLTVYFAWFCALAVGTLYYDGKLSIVLSVGLMHRER